MIHTGSRVRAIVYHNECEAEIGWFHLPKFNEPKFYVTIGSYNAFKIREGTRLVNWLEAKRRGKRYKIPERRTYCTIIEDECKMHAKEVELKIYADLPTFEHDNLWEFYLAIGYDYKKQKYIFKENAC